MSRRAAELALVVVAGCGRGNFDPCNPAGTPDSAVDAQDPLTRGLRAHYTFDDPNPLHDVAGNHDATCVNVCPVQVVGRIGPGAANFAGAQCAAIPDALELRATSFTISLWANLGPTSGNLFARPLDGATTASNSFQIEGDTTNAMVSVAVAGLYTAAGISPGWTHIAATYDGAVSMLYVDGLYQSQRTVGPVSYGASDAHLIGCDYDMGVYVDFFGGSLDDVRFYDRALAPAEITALSAM